MIVEMSNHKRIGAIRIRVVYCLAEIPAHNPPFPPLFVRSPSFHQLDVDEGVDNTDNDERNICAYGLRRRH